MRARGVVAALLAALAVVGCTGPADPEPMGPEPSAAVIPPGELEQAKKAAGIEDCPESDPAVAASRSSGGQA